MAGPANSHPVGWSIFGLTIIALAGGIAINNVLAAGARTAVLEQRERTRSTISGVYRRTRQWPKSDQDPLLSADDRDKLHELGATFQLNSVAPPRHQATYDVHLGDRILQMDVPEQT